ncbi:MAG: hypothetical protein EAZ89_20355 [Bacteroidetes bacterium]|nr:MAG: hypothetical protein EAZ89_20355 [Bacteroidota bacterium]
MKKLIGTGKWWFVSGFLVYVILHLTQPDVGAKEFVPAWMPFPYFWNYFTGILIVAFMVSAFIGKLDKLASVLLALYIFLMMVLIHIPNVIEGNQPTEIVNVFRNIIMIGGALMFAGAYAKDSRFVG